MTTFAATGHRPDKLGGYGARVENRLDVLAELFLMNNTPDLFISGMASGWDQACARVCIVLNIPFIAAVPFFGQEAKWPRSAQTHYLHLLKCAKDVKVVSEGGYESWKMFKRNEWMVDQLTGPDDRLVALWNGGHSGGTWDAVKYAQDKGKIIVNLWPEWEKLG